MKLIYDIGDKPRTKETIVFAFQQMIAIMAATLLVPILMSTYTMTDGTTLTLTLLPRCSAPALDRWSTSSSPREEALYSLAPLSPSWVRIRP